MVAFLEKHFEFTISLSMNECVERLEAKSKRGSGWLASKRDILVSISDDGARKKFVLDRDVGRGLYAEVQGYIAETSNNLVYVGGFGRVPFLVFLFNAYFFVATCFFAYVFRNILPLSIFFILFTVVILIFLRMIFRNRNDLIKIVHQALDADIVD